MELSKSENIQAALASMGIFTPLQVIEHLPRRYESYALTPRKDVYDDKERMVKLGHLSGALPRPLRFKKRTLFRFYFETSAGESFLIEAWNRNYLSSFLHPGEEYTLSGIYEKKRHSVALINIVKGKVSDEKSLRPVYSLPQSLSSSYYSGLVKRCFEKVTIDEKIPRECREKYRLLPRGEALKKAHFPATLEDVKQSYRSLKYQEALLFEAKNLIVRGENKALRKPELRKIDRPKLKGFIRSLAYSLTEDQKASLGDIIKDMDGPEVMYRLLQGDVGTGKTLVAALAAYANFTRSEQTALLAPTDTLARQHYDNLKKLFAGTSVNLALLVGSLSSEERHNVLEGLQDGTIDLVVGTHALFSRDVEYAYLGLAIIDEQHKFGVNQRSLLLDKGEHADLLLMSATPIPRTLTLTLYGDLDVSSLYMFPQGKRKVTTLIEKPTDPKIQDFVKEAIETKHRAYVVVPEIVGHDLYSSVQEIYEKYSERYPRKVTLMHGKMDEEERNLAYLAFRSGLTPILVATSLIEVGIDVKEANLMVIYSPSHFGLSSLHQLRGRIGRDGSEATCILAYEPSGDEDGLAKLKVLQKYDDGFKIAEEDLRLRGPGDLVGTRQSGLPSFELINIVDDIKIFECARDDAAKILSEPSKDENPGFIEQVKKDVSSFTLS